MAEKPPARPLSAKGGIRAQTKSRKVGKNWWTKRWMGVLENYYMGAELPRGRAYAQAGQVLDIQIGHGEVKAVVQGARKTPHKITIKFKAAPKRQWEKLAKTLASEAIYVAKLLSGQMPEYIEDVFTELGLSLFPDDIRDLDMTIDNKKVETPDKSVIAVYYLLAEEFDRDPFLFMKLRGLDRDKLIEAIGAKARTPVKRKADYVIGDFHDKPLDNDMPLSDDLKLFWSGSIVINEEHLGDVRIPPTPGALSKHLGHFPMWRGEERFLDALELVYKKASTNGMNVFLGDW